MFLLVCFIAVLLAQCMVLGTSQGFLFVEYNTLNEGRYEHGEKSKNHRIDISGSNMGVEMRNQG